MKFRIKPLTNIHTNINNMDILPLELWNIIENYTHLKTQINMKHTCKKFYGKSSDKKYVSKLQKITVKRLAKKQITYCDIVKYIISQNEESISSIINFIDTINDNKLKESLNCIHVPYPLHADRCYNTVEFESAKSNKDYYTPEKDYYMRCKLCNIEYKCFSCNCTYLEKQTIIEDKINEWNYGKTQCEECHKCVMAYLCWNCNKSSTDCWCTTDTDEDTIGFMIK